MEWRFSPPTTHVTGENRSLFHPPPDISISVLPILEDKKQPIPTAWDGGISHQT